MAETCNVDVWLIPLQRETAIILSPDEEVRAARFRFERDRVHWSRARSVLRTILGGCAGIPASNVEFVLGPHGKPSLTGSGDIEFNLSHAGDWAMVAVTRSVPVGVDIERIRDNVDMAALLHRLGERDLSTSQAGLFSAWTRREAVTKAVGGALMEAPAGDFRVCDLDAPLGYAAALALIGSDPRVRRQDALVLPSGTGASPFYGVSKTFL